MRSSFIHEGRPGDESHSFRFRDSPTNATYMSRAYSNRPVIGFHPSFMTLVLERCIDGFEAEAVASRVDPVLPRNRHEAKQ